MPTYHSRRVPKRRPCGDIIIYDINGSPVGDIKTGLLMGINQNLVWDAGAKGAGVYYYQAKTTSGSTFTGKLVKL